MSYYKPTPTSPSQTYTSPPSWSGTYVAVWGTRRRNRVTINLFKSCLFICFYTKQVFWVRSLNDCLSNRVSSSQRAAFCFQSPGSREPYLRISEMLIYILSTSAAKLESGCSCPALWYSLMSIAQNVHIPNSTFCQLLPMHQWSPMELNSAVHFLWP